MVFIKHKTENNFHLVKGTVSKYLDLEYTQYGNLHITDKIHNISILLSKDETQDVLEFLKYADNWKKNLDDKNGN